MGTNSDNKPKKDYEVGYKKPPKESRFKKGTSPNPLGAGAHKNGRVSTNLKRLCAKELNEIGDLILMGDIPALKKIIDEKESGHSVLKVWVATCAYKAMAKGEVGDMETLLNRFIGRVTVNVDHTTAGESMKPRVVVTIPDNGRTPKDGK